MLEYDISARRIGPDGSTATVRSASIELDTSLQSGRADAFNPVELLLAGLAACMLKGIERSAATLGFQYRTASVSLHAVRQDAPPKLTGIEYRLLVDTDEPDRRLDLLHRNVLKYGTISNTLAAAVPLTGSMARGA